MKKIKNSRIILLIILVGLGLLIRTYRLEEIPSTLNADEAALGYNAYSLLKTGKDEHGNIIPVNLESFGDYKPALYSYLLVPVFKIFGYSDFNLRMVSSILGTISIVLIYYLVFLLFKNKKSMAPFFASCIMTFSQWHIHYSRGGWEVNISLFIILAALIYATKWLQKPYLFKYLNVSLILFVLSTYTYQAARIFAPLFVLVIFITNIRIFRADIKKTLTSSLIAALFSLPLLFSMLNSSNTASRLSGVGFLSDEGPLNRIKELRGHYSSTSNILGRLLHNRPVAYTRKFIENYLSHFNPAFLFVDGDEVKRNKVPETGLVYYSLILPLIVGFYIMIKTNNIHSKIVLIVLLISPIASSITFQVPSALRAMYMLIPIIIMSSIGMEELRKNRKYLLFFLIAIFTYETSRYMHMYYVHYSKEYPSAWQHGFPQVAKYISEHGNKYERIYITDSYDQPYILLLWYLKYDPRTFQNSHVLEPRDKFSFSTVRTFDKFIFTNTSSLNVTHSKNTLIFANPNDTINSGFSVINNILYPNGSVVFKVITR